MATIDFRDFTLNQTAITGKKNNTVTVVATKQRHKLDADRKPTQEVDGYSVDIIAAHGKSQTVKLPLNTEKVLTQIEEALRSNKTVTVNFGEPSTLRGICYAMNNNDGKLMRGVSATASTINIVKIIDDEEEYDDENIIL